MFHGTMSGEPHRSCSAFARMEAVPFTFRYIVLFIDHKDGAPVSGRNLRELRKHGRGALGVQRRLIGEYLVTEASKNQSVDGVDILSS